MATTRMPKITAVDLFCGVGGLTHGLAKSGISVKAGIDIESSCRYAYEANNKAKFIEADVEDLSSGSLAELFAGAELSLLAGCAPCQPFSSYSQGDRGRAGSNDWRLLQSFGRLVREVQPDLVTMENVPQLHKHEIFDGFLKDLKGYAVKWGVVECMGIGIPQARKRLVLIASRLGDEYLEIPAPTKNQRTVRQTIEALPRLSAGERHPEDPLHSAPALSDTNMKRIRASVPGGTWRDWDPSLRAACHVKETGATYPSVYGRMEWDKPSPTITTQSFGYGSGRFGHPEQDRAISLREAAMLQTFPRNYKFVGPDEIPRFNVLGRLIGNAVPVDLAKSIGKILIKHAAAYGTQ